jgi:hypothetical protein
MKTMVKKIVNSFIFKIIVMLILLSSTIIFGTPLWKLALKGYEYNKTVERRLEK